MKKVIVFLCLTVAPLFIFSTVAQTWQQLDSLRATAQENLDYAAALDYAQKALEVAKEEHGAVDTLYATSCYNVALLHRIMGKYKLAKPLYVEVKAIRDSLLGKNHPLYAQVCNSLAVVLRNLGEYNEAESLYREAMDIYSKTLGESDENYLNTLSNLAALYRNMGRLEEAEPLYIKTKDVNEKTFGRESSNYALSCNGLAVFYLEVGKYPLAEELFIEAKDIRERVLGKDHPDYAMSCANLAGLYRTIGDYKSAEPLYVEAKTIREKVLGNKHPDYAASCNSLGLLYGEMGNYIAAEPLFIENLEIIKNEFGEEHRDYAIGCLNFGLFYQKMGNYPAAESYYLKAKSIAEKVFGKESTYYASILFNVASFYHETEKYQIAEPLYLEVVKIFDNKLGKSHIQYGLICSNLATFYTDIGKYAESESLFFEVKKILENKVGKEHSYYATVCGNLGYLYQLMGKNAEAKTELLEAKAIREKTLGKEHPSYSKNCFNLGYVYHQGKNYPAAEQAYIEALDISNRNIIKNFAFLSDNEKELYFQTQAPHFQNFYSFSLDWKNEHPNIAVAVYNNAVQTKGLLLKSSTAIRTAILKSNDKQLLELYNNWISLRKEISTLYNTQISKRKKDPEALEQEANVMEKELIGKVQAFSDFEKMQSINWENVRDNLKLDEAAIEFINFAVAGHKDSVLYAALIVKPLCSYPEMVYLFNEKDLEAILGRIADNNLRYVSSIYGTNIDPNVNLYNIIWKPIEASLGEVKTIYISPSGLLHKVSFAAMAKGKNVYLCDSYNLNIQSSTAKVAIPASFTLNRDITASVFGGINYNSANTEEEVWNYLEGTKHEVEIIKSLLSEKKVKTSMFIGNESTEAVMKQSGSNVIHIATHGFFYLDPKDQKLAAAENVEAGEVLFRGGRGTRGFGVWSFVRNPNPLMRSGLTFAGANRVWTDKYVSGDKDGVLTAEEVVNIDMQNTELVVLSACETGLGDIKGSEGVYGLQRAFKMAGAKFIIMSLWQVPDKETVEFMETFYTKLLKKKDLRKAFVETQQAMRAKYDPYYWAAFVLVE